MKLRILAVVAGAVLIAGCGDKDSPPAPTATTTATTTTTTSTAAPSALAPYAAAPCSVLTDAQRTAISKKGTTLPKGEPDDTKTAPSCVFGDYQHKVKGYYFVTVYIQTDKGLADLTSDHAKGLSPDYWKPAELGDHQVIYYTHEGSQESCDVAIGFTATTRVEIELYEFDNFTPRERGSCKGTTAVAEQVLATITGGR